MWNLKDQTYKYEEQKSSYQAAGGGWRVLKTKFTIPYFLIFSVKKRSLMIKIIVNK